MRIMVSCSCDDEEHEEYIEPEWDCGRLGYNGIGEGDALPCGRIVTLDDVAKIYEQITDPGDP